MKRERARGCGEYQEEKIRGKEGREEERKKEKKKDLLAQVYTYMKGVPPTFVKKKFFCNHE